MGARFFNFGFKPLPCKQAERALKNLGFTEGRAKGTSHRQWRKITKEGRLLKVTLDCHKGEVKAVNVRSMIKQANVTEEMFYRAADGEKYY
jgi:predicted RNA binding protein YcfA (HicA-like mRNA interferase family)